MTRQVHDSDTIPDVMTVQDVAQYLRLSKAKVYRMAQANEIPAIKIGSAWRFKKELIDEWMRHETERRTAVEPVTDH